MKKRFFEGIKTRQELKKAYVKLLRIHHPDNGGDLETCKALNTEYEELAKVLPETASGAAATEQNKKADADLDKEIRDLLNKIITLEGINIEVVGTWIWIDGNTYPHKEILKQYGFQWSKARKKWHASPYGTGTYYKGKKKDFDTLRNIYGSTAVETEKTAKIA